MLEGERDCLGAAPVGSGAAGGDLQNLGIPHGCELVQAVAVHYERALGAQTLQGGRHEAADGRRVDADEAIRRISRVQQWAQDVECRAHLVCQTTHKMLSCNSIASSSRDSLATRLRTV